MADGLAGVNEVLNSLILGCVGKMIHVKVLAEIPTRHISQIYTSVSHQRVLFCLLSLVFGK